MTKRMVAARKLVPGPAPSGPSGAVRSIISQNSRDRGRPIPVGADIGVFEPALYSDHFEAHVTRDARVAGDAANSIKIRVSSVDLKSCPAVLGDLLVRVSNLFLSTGTIVSLGDHGVGAMGNGAGWRATLKKFPSIAEMRRGGLGEYRISEKSGKDDNMRALLVIPIGEENEEIFMNHAGDRIAARRGRNVTVLPPSLLNQNDVFCGTGTPKEVRFDRTEGAHVVVINLVFILPTAVITPGIVMGQAPSTLPELPLVPPPKAPRRGKDDQVVVRDGVLRAVKARAPGPEPAAFDPDEF